MVDVPLDYGKCFDRVPVHIVLELAAAAGLSPKLVTPLKSLLKTPAAVHRRTL